MHCRRSVTFIVKSLIILLRKCIISSSCSSWRKYWSRCITTVFLNCVLSLEKFPLFNLVMLMRRLIEVNHKGISKNILIRRLWIVSNSWCYHVLLILSTPRCNYFQIRFLSIVCWMFLLFRSLFLRLNKKVNFLSLHRHRNVQINYSLLLLGPFPFK